jgi:N-acetylmuramoyl-L-alanine amidase
MNNKPLIILLDSGHGGIVDGKYTTAPAKMFKHSDGTIAYEGVINRRIKADLKKQNIENVRFIDVTNTNADKPLRERVKEANELLRELKPGKYNFLYLSIHSNAGGGSGFEVFTSPGQTRSDLYGQVCCEEIKKEFTDFAFRPGIGDGDLDKEEKFYVLVKTFMPAILLEMLFFDNPKDWKYQQTDEYYERVTKVLVSFINRSLKEIK